MVRTLKFLSAISDLYTVCSCYRSHLKMPHRQMIDSLKTFIRYNKVALKDEMTLIETNFKLDSTGTKLYLKSIRVYRIRQKEKNHRTKRVRGRV